VKLFLHILLACLIVMSSPVVAQDPTTPIAAESSAEVDAQIAIRLRDILGELGSYDDVTVVVSDGVVTFRGTAETTASAAELETLAVRLDGVVAVRNEVTETADLGRRLDPAWDRFQARIDQVLIKLPLALVAAALFAVVVAAGIGIARARWPWDKLAPNAFIANIYRQLIRIAFVILGIVLALDVLNATALLSTILGAAGIIGLAIGFAVRDTVENFIASVLLSFRQPFSPNDTIEINGDEGKVVRLTSRATILLSFDGNQIRIPNATVYKSRIVNYSKNAERRFKFEILIDRHADLGAAKAKGTDCQRTSSNALRSGNPRSNILDRQTGTNRRNYRRSRLGRSKRNLTRARKKRDATQVISVLSPISESKAPSGEEPQESASVADVQATDDDELEELVTAERENPEAENLLRDGAQSE